MKWDVEYTDEFEAWWDRLNDAEQDSVQATVMLLSDDGPHLGFPHTSDIKGARHGNLRELRVQHAGRPYRVLYAFDPRRCAILLLAETKPVKIVGIRNMCRWPNVCTTSTWKH
jgi:hypothetical protein